ncbi:unnamed protein product [Symbiodinium natans]|uniref:Uncharacterized protein n=1 Tax=Symbiodinium natans TaxID=878477 RepID=A0A812PDX6_9DINO|nr:unnamed protein product [Symbiodinium natans]
MAETREEMLRGVLGEIEKLLVKLLMESERTTTSENMLLRNTSTDALTQSLPMASAALSTGDTMKQRYPLSPTSPTEPPPLLSEEALCQKENSRHSNRSSNHSQKAEHPSKKSLRSVNIVDELYELDGSSLESLELFQLNECWDHMGDAHVSRFTRRASMAITANSHMAISSPIIPIAQRRRCTAVKQVWASTFLFLILLELVQWPLIAFQSRYVGNMDFVKLGFEPLRLHELTVPGFCLPWS